MRRDMSRKDIRLASRYIPKDSIAIQRDGGVVYTYQAERNGRMYYTAVAYRGTAGKAEWHYTYNSPEKRAEKINDWFAGIASREVMKAERKAERKAKLEEFKAGRTSGDFSLTETAELIRRTLADIFPNTKFSVRSKSYTGGCSIDVSWTDGPTVSQVKPVLDRFEGADFDGMQDLKTYREPYEWNGKRVRFHVDYVFASRTESNELITEAADRVSYETGLPMPTVEDCCVKNAEQRVPFHFFWPDSDKPEGVIAHDSHNGEWYSQLVYQVARSMSRESEAARPKLPEFVTADYIDATVRRLLSEVA